MVFDIKMNLDYIYGLLNLLELKCNHFNSLFQAESEFKNSNFGGKSSELVQCRFPNKFDFSVLCSLNENTLSFRDLLPPYLWSLDSVKGLSMDSVQETPARPWAQIRVIVFIGENEHFFKIIYICDREV